MLRMSAKFADAAVIDPVPELCGAHARFALGHAEFGDGGKDFGARGAGEIFGRAQARLGEDWHGRLLARAGKGDKGGLWRRRNSGCYLERDAEGACRKIKSLLDQARGFIPPLRLTLA